MSKQVSSSIKTEKKQLCNNYLSSLLMALEQATAAELAVFIFYDPEVADRQTDRQTDGKNSKIVLSFGFSSFQVGL